MSNDPIDWKKRIPNRRTLLDPDYEIIKQYFLIANYIGN